MLRGALAARLFSEAAWQANPGYAQVRIDRPVFVTGLPRTGTTALHRLLAADPAHQGLAMWLAEVPQPRPPREAWPADPVFQYIQAACERHHAEHPEFMAVHYVAADQVEECWQLLRQSMRSISWECLAHLPTYSAWLAVQDWTDAYRRHRRNLQLIGLPEAGRRWVLKNPSHLFALDALLAVYPDALVIQTHRDPAHGDRVGLQPGRAGVGRLVHHVHRRGHRPGPAGAVGVRSRAVHGRSAPGMTRLSSTTCPTTTWRPIRWARRRRLTPTSACRSAAPPRMPCGVTWPAVGPGQRTSTRSPTSA